MSAPTLQAYIQGQGSVNADNLNTFEQTCDNVANLRAFIGLPGMQVFMRGYVDPGDGGQGDFYWNANGTGPDDGGVTTIVPNGAATGVWTRIIGGTNNSIVSVISSNRTVGLSDAYTAVVADSDLTLTLDRTTLLNNFFWFDVDADGGSVTLSPNANDTITVNGISWPVGVAFVIGRGESARIYTNASGNWYVKFLGPRLAIESTLASASTTDLGASPTNVVTITGTNAITSFGTSAGVGNPLYFLRFTTALTLTHSTSLFLPSEQNLVTQNGDNLVAQFLGSGNWKVIAYQAVTGQPIGGQVQGLSHLLSVTVTSNTGISVNQSGLMLADATGNGNSYFARTAIVTNSTATSGAGGLDTGSIAANTWYAVHVIYNPTTNALNTVICVASGNPVMPSGYTFRARVGCVRTDGSTNLKRTLQYDNKAVYVVGTNPTVIPILASGTASSWTAVPTGNFVPPTAHRINMVAFTDAGVGYTYVVPNNSYGTSPSGTNMIPLGASSQTTGSATFIYGTLTLESTNIYWGSNAATSAIGCIGWEDTL